MIYLLTYTTNQSDNKLGQIEAEDYIAAKEKADSLFHELQNVSGRIYTLLEITSLRDIRKLDSLE